MADTIYVEDVFTKLAAQEGFNVSVENIDDVCTGCVITADKSFNDFLVQHAMAYNYLIIDGDPIRIVRRALGDTFTADYAINQTECVVTAGAPAVAFKRVDTADMPRQVEIQYVDPARNYMSCSQSARHFGAPTNNANLSIALDFIITADLARAMAFDILYRIWSQQLSLGFEHRDLTIEPGDTIELTCDQGTFDVLVREVIYTANRTVVVQAAVLLTEAGITVAPGEADYYTNGSTTLDGTGLGGIL